MSNPVAGRRVDRTVWEQLSRIVFAPRSNNLAGGLGMFQEGIALLKRSWPLGLLALPFGAVYCLFLCLFPDSIEAYVEMRAYTQFSTWGGVQVLFLLNSVIIGWLSAVVSERSIGTVGAVALLLAVLCCLGAIGAGFCLAWFFLGSLSDPMWEMLAYSLVSAVGASALRTYLAGIL